jgi:hypothetical protein
MPASDDGIDLSVPRPTRVFIRGSRASQHQTRLRPGFFILGHASVLTTARYLGCKQNLEEPINDGFGCLFSEPSICVEVWRHQLTPPRETTADRRRRDALRALITFRGPEDSSP